MDNPNWKEKAKKFGDNVKVQSGNLLHILKENKNISILVVVFFTVVALALVALSTVEKKQEAAAVAEVSTQEAEQASLEETEAAAEEGITVLEEALEKDAYPEVNNLIKQYYQALVAGDMETIKTIKNHVDEEEELKIVKKSEFIEGYPMITVYTKKGPAEGSFVVYVQYEVKFVNIENTAPGLNTLYICTDEEGKYYINAKELDESVVEYLKTISVQNDVVDLFNTVQVAYNDVKTQDEALSTFLDELPNLLVEAVSEAIIEQEAAEAALNPVEEEEEPEVVVVVTKVKTTDVVNVRSSDSLEADKLGKTSKGQILELVEERLNGWSKVIFEGKEGFIKTEFLQAEETEMQVNTEESHIAGAENVIVETEGFPRKGKLKDTVNVRKTASTEADIIALLTKGSEIEVLEQYNNGWSKVNHNTKGEAYIKSEFIELEEKASSDSSDSKETNTETVAAKKGKLTDTVNVRKEPSTDAVIVGLYSKGKEIEIVEQMSNGWTKINHPNGIAYVKSDYVEVQ